jgi:integrase-like protein
MVFRRDERTPLEALTPPPHWWSGSRRVDASPADRSATVPQGTRESLPSTSVTPRRPEESELRADRMKLVSSLREILRTRHYSRRTEKAYVGWVARFLCGLPRELAPQQADKDHVSRFLSRLAMQDRVAASTQNQAFSALLFLFREVLKRDVHGLDKVARAKRPVRVPQVLSRPEVSAILGRLRGTP